MKKLFTILVLVLMVSCSKDDTVINETNNYTTSDCNNYYETFFVTFDSQDNLVKFNGAGQWYSSIDLDMTDAGDINQLEPANHIIGFRHNGWGVLNIVAADGYELHTVNLFPEINNTVPIHASATNLSTDRYTLYYDNGIDYANGSDTYTLTVTLKVL